MMNQYLPAGRGLLSARFRSYLLAALPLLMLPLLARAQATTVAGPSSSGLFGSTVTVLTNGNYVVTDLSYSSGGNEGVGAVYLYDGSTNTLLSTLTGSRAYDQVGYGGVKALAGGAYVVSSPYWGGGAGAVTWAPASGLSGVVSTANSLTGSQNYDHVGYGGITPLAGGAYVVNSYSWNNGTTGSVGAVTWAPAGGLRGVVSAANSLIGSQFNDQVGRGGVTVLAGGAYVVGSYFWSNGATANVGAVTWAPASGLSGVVSTANSLIGSRAYDQVGYGGVTALAGGAYVVDSYLWSNGATANVGAVTWAPASGMSGVVSAANSLTGTQANDQVGYIQTGRGGVTALTDGAYAICSSRWANGAVANAGAVTWVPAGGLGGVVSAANSLTGTQANDYVGNGGVTALSGGAYAVCSYQWTNGAVANAGAVTWAPAGGIVGVVSAANSLTGAQANDYVGSSGVTALAGGAYAVCSLNWSLGTAAQAGAVTWVPAGGLVGVVSAANSLIGFQANDQVGNGGVTALAGGAYAVCSYRWANGPTGSVGAVTWAPAGGLSGAVTTANSLTGSQANDYVGRGGVTALAGGAYVVRNSYWANGSLPQAGAITLGSPAGTTGPVTACNSSLGGVGNRGGTLAFAYRESTATLLVGRPYQNSVTLGVGAPPAPTGAASQSFGSGATVASLAATGTAVQWYATPGGGSPLPTGTPLASSSYYASQTVAGCESLNRLAVAATIVLPVRPATLGGPGLALFPNPAPGAATLTSAPAGAAVQVLDALGRLVATTTADAKGTAALAGLAPGLYLVRAGSDCVRLAVE